MNQYKVKLIVESNKFILAKSEEDAKRFLQNWLDLEDDLDIVPDKVYAGPAELIPKLTVQKNTNENSKEEV